jgi:hypothetical protein
VITKLEVSGKCECCNKYDAEYFVNNSDAQQICNYCIKKYRSTLGIVCKFCNSKSEKHLVKNQNHVVCSDCHNRNTRRCRNCSRIFHYYVERKLRMTSRYNPPKYCRSCLVEVKKNNAQLKKKEQENLLKYQYELKKKRKEQERERHLLEKSQAALHTKVTHVTRLASTQSNLPNISINNYCEACGKQIVDGKCGCFN